MSRFLFVLLTVLATSVFAQDFTTYRLPNNTRPETYDISIRTRIDQSISTFTGSVRIGIVAVESTNFIRLHHAVERLESVTVLTADEVPITIGDLSYNGQYDFLTIPIVGNNLTEGARYFVDIDYVGMMNYFSGFYRSSYNVNNTWLYFASTLFEPTYARTAFPCYDEPQIRANFTIRLTHVSSFEALSNMPVRSVTQNSDGSATTVFDTSPAMSTYLVAFHVSDFAHVTSTPPRPVPQRLFSKTTAVGTTDLAFEAIELFLDAITDYIGVDFSLPKLDHVAVPNFPSTASENWGLVTYHEYYTLYNESIDFYTQRLFAVRTISHQLAHQFFGNLVTPSWWTFLWMKEGFATFFEFFGIDLVHPEWRMRDYFVVENNHAVFRVDSSENTEPMTFYVEHPTDINFHYNSIAWSKAGAVIRMFYYMFGEATFMGGVKSYLESNSFSVADEQHLFDAIATHVQLDPEIVLPPTGNVSEVMGSWTRQAGFPLITVERNYGDRTDQVTLRQERYYSPVPQNRLNTTWFVPYNLATPDTRGFVNSRVEGWIPQGSPSVEITVDSLDAEDYLLINNEAAGFYRVLYDERNYRLISNALIRNSSLFHPTNVAQLIDDAYEFYENGLLNITTMLDLIRVLEFQTDHVSWSTAFNFISYVDGNFKGHRNYPIWTEFIRTLTEELYDSVGVEDIPDEPILRKLTRENIVSLACEMGSVHCRSDATRRLRRYIETGEDFHHNIRMVLQCASMRSATRTDFNIMWNRLQSLPFTDFTGRYELIEMLSCTRSRPLLTEFVQSAYNFTIYSEFEPYNVINAVLENGGNDGIDITIEFFIENAVQTIEVIGSWILQSLANYISNAEHIERFIFLQNVLIEAGLLTTYDAEFNLYLIDNSVGWLNDHGEDVNTWLMENFF